MSEQEGELTDTKAGGAGGNDAPVVVLLCTVPNEEIGRGIAHAVVKERLAGCVNLVPGLTSIYRWEGAVQEDAEVLMVLKTRPERVERLTQSLIELHPYDVPEVLTLPTTGGHEPYLAWIRGETTWSGDA
ncbi:MAG TPA: divalent-cation tolerance protein CutA [Myxococcaceae bacterium]|nr:divalent-cation tolerance protein CutA [Myxococcaceae bacterium]